MIRKAVLASGVAGLLLAAGVASARAPEGPPAPRDAARPSEAAPAVPKPPGPGKYEDVVTDKAVTTEGLFRVHRVGDKVYYEIPPSLLGREMLWYSETEKVPSGVGTAGRPVADRIVRWERRGDKILLRGVSFLKRGEGGSAVARAVERASLPPVFMAFDVEAEGKDNAAVVDVTRLLASDAPEFSTLEILAPLRLPAPPGVDPSRSFVEDVKSFPSNIEARSVVTYGLGPPFSPPADPSKPPPQRIPEDVRSLSVLVHHSLVLLPREPMRGRLFDPRVGYFAEGFEDYAGGGDRMVRRQYITRFRLEKKDPAAPVSDPVRPIVFYIAREVPEMWRPYVRQGVEDWNEAFEAAGFRNAVACREAPAPGEDPAWNPEDARYSVIRWGAEPIANASGPHVHDPRSGEIISSHVLLWHDILKLMQGWYFVLCAAQDDRARTLPLPEALTGELIRYVVVHEVGHALGLRHNHKAASAYTTAQLRDPAFAERYGAVASVMSYGRFNYVAQPGDGVRRLIPRIGPYDRFAVAWGYGPLPDAPSAQAEIPALDAMAARQIDDPWLRFGGEDGPAEFDPTVKMESIGDDSLASASLGLSNQDRVLDLLVPATTKLGEDYTLLEDTYGYLLQMRFRWFAAALKLVGGVVENRTLGGRGGEPFVRVPAQRQREAVRFLLENAFVTPKKLVSPAIVNRIRYFGVGDPLLTLQKSLLEDLLGARRFRLLVDAEASSPGKVYTAVDLFADVQGGLWRELESPRPLIDPYRRYLQRVYLDHVKGQLAKVEPPAGPADNPPPGDFPATPITAAIRQTDFRAAARAALRDLDKRIRKAAVRASDRMTASHLGDSLKEIDLILNPRQGS